MSNTTESLITLQELLNSGILPVGGVVTCTGSGTTTSKGEMTRKGTIVCKKTKVEYATPTAWVKTLFPNGKGNRSGWFYIRYKGRKLNSFKKDYVKKVIKAKTASKTVKARPSTKQADLDLLNNVVATGLKVTDQRFSTPTAVQALAVEDNKDYLYQEHVGISALVAITSQECRLSSHPETSSPTSSSLDAQQQLQEILSHRYCAPSPTPVFQDSPCHSPSYVWESREVSPQPQRSLSPDYDRCCSPALQQPRLSPEYERCYSPALQQPAQFRRSAFKSQEEEEDEYMKKLLTEFLSQKTLVSHCNPISSSQPTATSSFPPVIGIRSEPVVIVRRSDAQYPLLPYNFSCRLSPPLISPPVLSSHQYQHY